MYLYVCIYDHGRSTHGVAITVAVVYRLTCSGHGLKFVHIFGRHPVEFLAQVSDVVEFAAAKNNSSSEVQDLLESIQAGLITKRKKTPIIKQRATAVGGFL